MHYTTNYQLPQWEAADRILMRDFNDMTAKIEAGLTGAVPAGTIALWSGAVSAIPAGWALCDGGSGTPDLRGRFVVGAGGDYAVGDTGGAATEELASYNHTSGSVFGTFYAAQTATRENRPPYYALCYIMKL